jgi:hypothetical protein
MLVCPRCQRSNPDEAVFCHFDGAELRPAHGGVDPQAYHRLPHPFVFPSGRQCQTYDELAEGCQQEWTAACDLLRRGILHDFLGRSGRLDLADAAREAEAHIDDDIALSTFLLSLPLTVDLKPHLDLRPRRILLGRFRAGEIRSVHLMVNNIGKGLLHGTVALRESSDWLRLSGADATGEYAIKTRSQQPVTVQVDTRGLPAGQVYAARLTVITNGGIDEVPVRFDLTAFPFPKPPFERVDSPHALARVMRSVPRQAAALLESGEVAHWFGINGWIYPVEGSTAPGVGAVQQFFEGMGLARAPRVQLAETELRFTCVYPEVVRGEIRVQSSDRKWVYAQGQSDSPWLRLLTRQASGPRLAVLPFEIDSSLLDIDRMYVADVEIVANAGQRLTLRVRVEVRRPEEPLTRKWLRPFRGTAL